MVRLALIPLGVVLAVLLLLVLTPDRRADLPSGTIDLAGATVTLFPRTDPGAIWYFEAPAAEYDPTLQEATLISLTDGRRTVGGVVDFTLESERVTIDQSENLRGELMTAHLQDDDLDLIMGARGDREVFVNQAAGRFEVPHAVMSGPDLGESVFEDMRISFDFNSFESGGPGTVGYARLLVD